MRSDTPPLSPDINEDDVMDHNVLNDFEVLEIYDVDDFENSFNAHLEEPFQSEDETNSENEEVETVDFDDRGTSDEEEYDEATAGPDDSIFQFNKHTKSIICGSLHPKEKLAVTGGRDDKAYVWNVETGDVIFESKFSDTIIGAEFSSDGNYVAIGDMSGDVRVFKASQNYSQIFENATGDLTWLKWHPKALILLAGTTSGEVYIWRLPSGDCKVLQGHNSRADCGEITADGKKLVVGYDDGVVKLWDLKTCAVLVAVERNNPLRCHEQVYAVCTDMDNNLFYSGGDDGHLMIIGANGPIGHIDETFGSIESISMCPDSEIKLVATGTIDGVLALWDITKRKKRLAFCADPEHGITKLFWLPGQILVASTLGGLIKAYDGRSGEEKFLLKGHRGQILDIDYNKENNLILTVSKDKTARIFNIPTIC